MIEQYTSPAVVNNSQEPWLVGEGVSLSGSIAIPSLDFNFVTNAFPGTVTFTRASTATYFDSAGVLQSAAINAPRLDYDPATLLPRGFLVEEQRTNSIRNNTMQGAVTGTPGTLPTNWSVVGGGLAANVIGTGTESGITYIDIQLVGTTTATSGGIRFEPTNFVAASSGQTWSGFFYTRIVSGSITNFNDIRVNVFGRTSANAANSDNSSSADFKGSLTASNLSQARRTHSMTLADATTNYINVQFLFGFNNGVAIDITIRIGLPQLELGAFATSVIPTTTTALTRSADVASVNTLSPWFNVDEGTLFVEASPQASNVAGIALVEVNDATTNNRMGLFKSGTSGNASLFVSVSGAIQAFTNSGAWTATGKLAGAYKLNDFASSFNGSAAATDTSGTIPTVTQLTLGRRGDGGNQLTGHLRRITYYPRRLSDAELVSITS